ncbi:MAG: SDR family oxidoreductase [Phycisphaerales bacterium]|nr:SDR family oxidoreductase [Phycisphaerales bacterium]MCB9858578.1 SDR family oxidoreductase [Phycisphaerales bacterium]
MTDVFLTGATGFLGHYTLAALLARRSTHVRILLSPPAETRLAELGNLLSHIGVDLNAEIRANRVTIHEGRLPGELGPEVLQGVDVIVHAAASTRFRKTRDGDPYRTNCDGTASLLEAADRADVPAFVFVSTAYVGGATSTTLPEAPLSECSPNANDYERSKWMGESAVRSWAGDDRRGIIVRPSILVGDRATGRATNFGGIYVLARAVELLARAVEETPAIDRRNIPLRIVGSPHFPINIIPICWAAERLARIATSPANSPDVVNLVNPAPPSTIDIKRWLEDVFDIAGGQFTQAQWPFPDASSSEDAFYAAGDSVHAYFARNLSFSTDYLRTHGDDAPLMDANAFKTCVHYARSTQWGRRNSSRADRPETPTCRVDPADYFENFVPRNLPRSTVGRINALTAVVRYVIDEKTREEWVCRYDAGRIIEVHRGPNSLDENFGFRIRRDAFENIVTGRESIHTAYFQSKVEIFGDTLMALKMVPIMDSFLQECPVPSDAL